MTYFAKASLSAAVGIVGLASLVFGRSFVGADEAMFLLKQDQPLALPKIAEVELSKIAPSVKKVNLSWEGGVYTVVEDKINNLAVYRFIDGRITSFIEDEKIGQIIEEAAKKIENEAKPKKVDTSGEVLDEGSPGRLLEREKAIGALKQALTSSSFVVTVPVSIKSVEPKTKTVAAVFNSSGEGQRIEINLTHQKMALFEGENKIGEYAVSTGKWSMPTPNGVFKINSKVPVAYSAAYDLYMPHWMAFVSSKYGIHGLPYKGDWVEGENHLGTPVSHGCVRLSWENAQTVYNWAEIGTEVDIHS